MPVYRVGIVAIAAGARYITFIDHTRCGRRRTCGYSRGCYGSFVGYARAVLRPTARGNGEQGFVSLDVIARESDVITLHTPLTYDGPYSTFHMADDTFFRSLCRKPWFINTSRGETTDTAALHRALNEGLVSQCIIDVWEHEPYIDHALLNRCYIGTPHIAGYSADGKACATQMSLQALAQHFDLGEVSEIVPPSLSPSTIYADSRATALLNIYNPHTDSDRLKAQPEAFEQLRGDYPLRREAKGFKIMIENE